MKLGRQIIKVDSATVSAGNSNWFVIWDSLGLKTKDNRYRIRNPPSEMIGKGDILLVELERTDVTLVPEITAIYGRVHVDAQAEV